MKRKWNLLPVGGFLLSLAAFFSYYFYFVYIPVTRDFPWASLLIFAGALALLGLGLRRAFARPERYRGRHVRSWTGRRRRSRRAHLTSTRRPPPACNSGLLTEPL